MDVMRITIPPMTTEEQIPFATSPLDEFRGHKKSTTPARGCRERVKKSRFTPKSTGGKL